MNRLILVNGKSFRPVAWTGGSTPDSLQLNSQAARDYTELHDFYLIEQISIYAEYWKTMPDELTIAIFNTRANYDAWATLRATL